MSQKMTITALSNLHVYVKRHVFFRDVELVMARPLSVFSERGW